MRTESKSSRIRASCTSIGTSLRDSDDLEVGVEVAGLGPRRELRGFRTKEDSSTNEDSNIQD